MARFYFLPWLLLSLIFLPGKFYGQSVGVGTTNPNPNAILHISSPNGNQGLLVPRLRTTQRLGMSLASPADDGMVVFDLDDRAFFYWSSGAWVRGLGNTTGGASIDNFILDEINRTISLSLAGDGVADQVIDLDNVVLEGIVTGTLSNTLIATGALNPLMMQPGADGQILITNTSGQVEWADQTILSVAGAIADGVTIGGTGTILSPLTIRPSGTPDQMLVTDGSGNSVIWADRFRDYVEYYAVDPIDFTALMEDNRADKPGPVVFASEDVFLSPGLVENKQAMTSIHVPHQARIGQFRFFYVDNDVNDLSVVVLRKELGTAAEMVIGSFTSAGSLAGIQSASIPINETADNSTFSYRILIKFNPANDTQFPTDAFQRFYGGIVEYTVTR